MCNTRNVYRQNKITDPTSSTINYKLNTSIHLSFSDVFQKIQLPYLVPYAKTSAPRGRRKAVKHRSSYPCPNCTSTFSRLGSLNWHLNNICGQAPRFRCPYCEYKTNWKKDVLRHMQSMHRGQREHVLLLRWANRRIVAIVLDDYNVVITNGFVIFFFIKKFFFSFFQSLLFLVNIRKCDHHKFKIIVFIRSKNWIYWYIYIDYLLWCTCTLHCYRN